MNTQNFSPATINFNQEEAQLFLQALCKTHISAEEFIENIDLWQRCLLLWSDENGAEVTEEALFLRQLQVCFINAAFEADSDKIVEKVNLAPFLEKYTWPEVVDLLFRVIGLVSSITDQLTKQEQIGVRLWLYSLCEMGLAANSVLRVKRQEETKNSTAA